MQFRNIPLVAIVILALLAPIVCTNASWAALDYGELWRESDTIVIGTVMSITSEGDDHFVDVEVERYLKYQIEASSLIIHYRVRTNFNLVTPERTIVSSSTSEPNWGFNDGERVYVFLRRVTPDLFEVVRGFQGKYSIVDGLGVSIGGRIVSIPTPLSQTTAMIKAGLGIAVFVTIWIKRDWLFNIIPGVGVSYQT